MPIPLKSMFSAMLFPMASGDAQNMTQARQKPVNSTMSYVLPDPTLHLPSDLSLAVYHGNKKIYASTRCY